MLHPGTLQPVGPDDLAPLFPMELILQEVATEREIEIPEPVRDIYRQWRPSPLFRARRLEKALDTPARIYYKYEGVSPAGSHKPNTAVAQAFYNKEAGVKRLTTETGAGQWGSSLAFAGALFGLEVQGVHGARHLRPEAVPARADGDLRRALRRHRRRTRPQSGRAILAKRAEHPGSLGIAISEAVEIAAQRDDTKYALGSVLNHVLLHQTVIGQEAMEQMEMAGDYPDVHRRLHRRRLELRGHRVSLPRRAIARRPARCASSPSSRPPARASRAGTYAYDFGDTAHLTPLAQDAHAGLDLHAARHSMPAACATTAWRRW